MSDSVQLGNPSALPQILASPGKKSPGLNQNPGEDAALFEGALMQAGASFSPTQQVPTTLGLKPEIQATAGKSQPEPQVLSAGVAVGSLSGDAVQLSANTKTTQGSLTGKPAVSVSDPLVSSWVGQTQIPSEKTLPSGGKLPEPALADTSLDGSLVEPQPALQRAGKVYSEPTSSQFAGVSNPTSALTPTPAPLGVGKQNLPVKGPLQTAMVGSQASTISGESNSASKIPGLQGAAASFGTASILSQTQPWSRSWVMRPSDATNPELKPLFSGASPEPAELQNKLNITSVSNPDLAKPTLGSSPQVDLSGKPLNASSLKSIEVQNQLQSGLVNPALLFGVSGAESLDASEMATPPGVTAVDTKSGAALSKAIRLTPNAVPLVSGGEYLETLKQAQAPFVFDGAKNSAGNQPVVGLIGSSQKTLNISQKKPGQLGVEDNLGTEAQVKGGAFAVAGQSLDSNSLQPPAQITAQVTLGANATPRLSREALEQLSGQIQGFNQSGKGGEIHLHLRPDNLGELHLRIITDGSQVGLKIQASDDRAKKIIEESIGFLKDSLAQKQLNLSAVDLNIQSMTGQGSSEFGSNQQGPQQNGMGGFNLMQDSSGRSAFGQNQNQSSYSNGGGENTGLARTSAGGISSAFASGVRSANRATSASGRIDVMA